MSGSNSENSSKRSPYSVRTALPKESPVPPTKEDPPLPSIKDEHPPKNAETAESPKPKEGGDPQKANSVEAVAPAKDEVDPFLDELYTTSDDEKIIAGLKTKKTSKELAAAAAKEVATPVPTTKTAKLDSKPPTSQNKTRRSKTAGTSRIMRGNKEISGKPTVLTFRALEERPNIARCVLVLCNISEIRLHYVLKSSDGSSIVASTGSGYIGPHAQLRIILTWTRSSKHSNWQDVPQQKLLLATQFLDGVDSDKYAVTHTRLLGRLGLSKKCTLADPPVEQLLLDAVGPQAPPPVQQPAAPPNAGRALADFVNNLTDRGLCVLIVVIVVFVLIC